MAWHVHVHQGRDRFSVADLKECYDTLHAVQPSNISQLLAALANKSTREVLRDGRGYYLERKLREKLDARYGNRAATIVVHELLRQLPAKLSDAAERDFLDEAIRCFRTQAFRAAIVMSWNLAYDHLCVHIIKNRLSDFNTALPKRVGKATPITTQDELTELKESQVLDVCRTAHITSGNVGKVLAEKLTKRNLAAHPSGISFNQLQAEEYITDLVNNAVLKI
ncbi:MAG: hypothetical protein WBC51_09690 [Vicinamibacterales bacterium]